MVYRGAFYRSDVYRFLLRFYNTEFCRSQIYSFLLDFRRIVYRKHSIEVNQVMSVDFYRSSIERSSIEVIRQMAPLNQPLCENVFLMISSSKPPPQNIFSSAISNYKQCKERICLVFVSCIATFYKLHYEQEHPN
jgi:hypothetical protein